MGNLTKNFSTWEFSCSCCGRHLCPELLRRLAIPLQELRDKLNKPIIIHSGYRCPKHNKAIGSAPTSQHVKGKAVDCHAVDITPEELARAASTVEAFREGGIGVYYWGCHLDIRGKKARWGKKWRIT